MGNLFNYCLIKMTQLVKCIASCSLIVDIILIFSQKILLIFLDKSVGSVSYKSLTDLYLQLFLWKPLKFLNTKIYLCLNKKCINFTIKNSRLIPSDDYI